MFKLNEQQVEEIKEGVSLQTKREIDDYNKGIDERNAFIDLMESAADRNEEFKEPIKVFGATVKNLDEMADVFDLNLSAEERTQVIELARLLKQKDSTLTVSDAVAE